MRASELRQLIAEINGLSTLGNKEIQQARAERVRLVAERRLDPEYARLSASEIEAGVNRDVPELSTDDFRRNLVVERQRLTGRVEKSRAAALRVIEQRRRPPVPLAFVSTREKRLLDNQFLGDTYQIELALLLEMRRMNNRADVLERRAELAQLAPAEKLNRFTEAIEQQRAAESAGAHLPEEQRDRDAYRRHLDIALLSESLDQPWSDPEPNPSRPAAEHAAAILKARRDEAVFREQADAERGRLLSDADKAEETDTRNAIGELDHAWSVAGMQFHTMLRTNEPLVPA